MNGEQQMAQTTIQFLDRTDMKGAEVPAFVSVRNWLMAKIEQADGAAIDGNGKPVPNGEDTADVEGMGAI